MLERIERTLLHAVMDSLTKPQPPALDEYLRCDFNSLQVWDNAEELSWLRFCTFPISTSAMPATSWSCRGFLRRFVLTFPGSLEISSPVLFSLCKLMLRQVAMQQQHCAITFHKPKTSPTSAGKMPFGGLNITLSCSERWQTMNQNCTSNCIGFQTL